MEDRSPVVASATDFVERLAEELETSDSPARTALEAFDEDVERVLDHYDLTSVRSKAHALTFASMYDSAETAEAEDDRDPIPRAVLAALIAADVEFRGPLRLSGRRKVLLAEVYEALGARLSRAGLYDHAGLAFRRAMALHRENEDDESEDRCGYLSARARTRATPRGLRRLTGELSFYLCGHGYRPAWLLGWVLVQLAGFTTAALVIGGDAPPTSVVYMGLVSFLGPLGLEDTEAMNSPARPLFIIESWTGVVTMSVFFALLVRKWFRM
ncbi:hypothetical protein [Nocardia jiangsuensis]|uniref:Uncharacterized protein n=1 Tax=Nocardia jiangsuensis TaxID=1691563 RepID=A0ABV8DSP3_9NOCA